MRYDEERDLDLERRLRRISEDPEPPVPASVFRFAETVTEERDTRMRPSLNVVRFSRRGFSGLVTLAGVAAALIIAVAGIGLAMSIRQNNIAAQSSTPTASGLTTIAPSASPSVVTTGSPTTSPTATPEPTPNPTVTAGTEGVPADVTLDGADPTADWTTVTWGAAPANIQMIGSGARWAGGWFKLVGAAAGPLPPRSLWLSADGRTWHGVIPPGEDIVASAAGLTAFDQGGRVAWTSADGLTWTQHTVQGVAVPMPRILTGSTTGIVAIDLSEQDKAGVYYSTDGLSWQQGDFAGWTSSTIALNVARLHDRWVLLGADDWGTETPLVAVFSSADGVNWTRSVLPNTNCKVSTNGEMLVGRDGIVIRPQPSDTPKQQQPLPAPRGECWLQSMDGVSWTADGTFGPLGSRTVDGATQSDGLLVSNGIRFIARRNGDGTLWTSYNGRDWTQLQAVANVGSANVTVVGPAFGVCLRGIFYFDGTKFLYGAAS